MKERLHNREHDPLTVEKEEWKRRQLKSRLKQLLTISSPIFILILWEFLSRTGLVDARFFPPPTEIVGTFITMGTSGELFEHIGISLFRIMAGFLLGVIPAIILGLLMGLYSPLRHFFSPLIMALMPIPTLALLPIILILFGIGEVSKIVTIAGSVFFPVIINTVAGVITIDRIYLDVARNYGANSRQFFFKIALPGALPVMIEGIQMGQAIALLTIVAAEMMGANSGIGYLIWTSYNAFLLKEMYVGLVLISFFGYLFSLILRGCQNKLLPWR
ncbi:ABC transporter permease [Halobacillus halophilus]|uniref:ABC-type transport system permease protein (Probable substrate sulfonate/nitrate/taurine) n=1 Tax=Halobacillus halophilus (strain ATCC 35676 / DSM 2266 / JCM 20832 / KCTC 3685 / LMG 17431 / NBRC 102448 / NCIMB 2269) TaxID=866895 RepID=I0JIV6_HALH3|nr:ABC transporter permease [Halobacillus halophilus]ASF38245.1 ABC transporter permease [Halobacillus halophilus]CCG44074.1 ABC-type transport system permease protein (probable substrate sulfonate/nitrate/taurine) [Halobacillus halophilus DSM 2266]